MQKNLSTRRLFLQRGLTLLAAVPTIPTFLDQTVLALTAQQNNSLTQAPSGKDGKILVVVQLSGGNDGLNTVVPYADDNYHRARPVIGEDPKTVLKINDYIGLQANLAPLKKMYDQGLMSVIQGVGYPNPNRSHFRSMDIWQSAQPDRESPASGWLGRYFDNTCAGCDPHVGISIGETLPLAMQGDRITPLSFDKPENYRYRGADQSGYLSLNKDPNYKPVNSPTMPAIAVQKPAVIVPQKPVDITPASQLDFLHRTAMDAQVSSDELLHIVREGRASANYPGNEFGQGLRTVASMIGGGLSTRVYYVTLGGFDTHTGETQRHAQLMTQLAQGVGAFWSDMETQGNDDRVLMMTFSEFGRRVAQNASGGTDHGTAAPMFMWGKNIQQGVIGDHPSLTDLDQGDLKYKIDFRSVYATVLQNWLNTSSKPILGDQYETLPIVKA